MIVSPAPYSGLFKMLELAIRCLGLFHNVANDNTNVL